MLEQSVEARICRHSSLTYLIAEVEDLMFTIPSGIQYISMTDLSLHPPSDQ